MGVQDKALKLYPDAGPTAAGRKLPPEKTPGNHGKLFLRGGMN